MGSLPPYREPKWDFHQITIGHEADFLYAHDVVNGLFTREEARVLAGHLREHGEQDVLVEQVLLPINLPRYAAAAMPARCWTPPPAEESLPIFNLKIHGLICERVLQ